MSRPEFYEVTIIVRAMRDKNRVNRQLPQLKIAMPGIKRSDILSPRYKAKDVQACVKQLELMTETGADYATVIRRTRS